MTTSLTVSYLNFEPGAPEHPLSSSDLETIHHLAQSHPELPLVIEGLPCEPYSSYVEDDLEELVSAYCRLEEQISSGKYGTHTMFFGQGSLLLAAEMSPETTVIEIQRSPHLDRRLTTQHKLEVATDQYLGSWRKVVQTCLGASRALGQPH